MWVRPPRALQCRVKLSMTLRRGGTSTSLTMLSRTGGGGPWRWVDVVSEARSALEEDTSYLRNSYAADHASGLDDVDAERDGTGQPVIDLPFMFDSYTEHDFHRTPLLDRALIRSLRAKAKGQGPE